MHLFCGPNQRFRLLMVRAAIFSAWLTPAALNA
jgi:hypothetical protein